MMSHHSIYLFHRLTNPSLESRKQQSGGVLSAKQAVSIDPGDIGMRTGELMK
jgi:hypothetical protein